MNSKEFKRWLSQQGATFQPAKGSHLKVYLNGKQSVLPMHNAGAIQTDVKRIQGTFQTSVVPAKAGNHFFASRTWIPAFAGMTNQRRMAEHIRRITLR